MRVDHQSLRIGILCAIDAIAGVLNGKNAAFESDAHLDEELVGHANILRIAMEVDNNLRWLGLVIIETRGLHARAISTVILVGSLSTSLSADSKYFIW